MLRDQKGHSKAQGAAYNRSPNQEKELSKKLQAQRVKASGRLAEKGDIRKKGKFRIESKCTEKGSYRIQLKDLKYIEEVALSHGEIPGMHIEFLDRRGVVKSSWVILPEYIATDLLKEY